MLELRPDLRETATRPAPESKSRRASALMSAHLLAPCVDGVLGHVCPNCGAAVRAETPSTFQDWKGTTALGKDPLAASEAQARWTGRLTPCCVAMDQGDPPEKREASPVHACGLHCASEPGEPMASNLVKAVRRSALVWNRSPSKCAILEQLEPSVEGPRPKSSLRWQVVTPHAAGRRGDGRRSRPREPRLPAGRKVTPLVNMAKTSAGLLSPSAPSMARPRGGRRYVERRSSCSSRDPSEVPGHADRECSRSRRMCVVVRPPASRRCAGRPSAADPSPRASSGSCGERVLDGYGDGSPIR